MYKYYPKTSNRYWIADHYTNGHAPQKTTILKWIRNHVNLNVGQKVTGQKFMDEKSQFVIWRKKIFDFFKVKFQLYFKTCIRNIALQSQGRTRRAPPLKLEKIWFFGVKSWFFTRNTANIFAPPFAIGKDMIFWRKIVIFHTKYPKNVRASLRSAQFLLNAPPPITWNPGSTPESSRTSVSRNSNYISVLKSFTI